MEAIIKNNKGYTLVLVMIIICVVMILGVTLSANTISTRKQFTLIENRNQATDLAEMGITHFQQIINPLIDQAESNATQDILNLDALVNTPQVETVYSNINLSLNSNFCNEFKNLYETNIYNHTIPSVAVENGQYVLQPQPFDTDCSKSPGVVQVKFKSIGSTSDSIDPVTLHVTFNIKQAPYKQITPTAGIDLTLINSIGTDIITDPLSKLNKLLSSVLNINTPTEIDVSQYLNNLTATLKISSDKSTLLSILGNVEFQNFVLNGASGISSLVVNGDIKFDQFSVNGDPPTGTNLFASGDVFIPELASLSGKTLNVCVLGDIYLFKNDDPPYRLPQPDPNDDKKKPTTSTIVNKCSSGHWSIDPSSGIDIKYK